MTNEEIPPKYDIVHFPSDGLYYPMLNGNYLWAHYRDHGNMETVSSPYQAIPCKSKDDAVAAIRRHMAWKAPVTLPQSEWRK